MNLKTRSPMKKTASLSVFLFAAGLLAAQITVTNATFPQIGDTLYVAVDDSPPDVDLLPPGGPHHWDFSDLDAVFSDVIVYRPAIEGSIGAQVPQAEIFAEIAFQTEGYYRTDGSFYELIAVHGTDPALFGLETTAVFDPPVVDRRAPLQYGDTFESTSQFAVAMATEDLPPELIDTLGLPIVPDSIRIRFTSQRSDTVDAYGTLTLPIGTFEVLREKRVDRRETRIDLLFAVVGWQDWTDVIALIPPFDQLLGTRTLITYNFFNDVEKEVILQYLFDIEGIQAPRATFKTEEFISTAKNRPALEGRVRPTPNPASGVVRFEMSGLPAGSYALSILDAGGKEVLRRELSLPGEHVETLNLSHLPAGTYLYRLEALEGPGVLGGRLVLRPQ